MSPSVVCLSDICPKDGEMFFLSCSHIALLLGRAQCLSLACYGGLVGLRQCNHDTGDPDCHCCLLISIWLFWPLIPLDYYFGHSVLMIYTFSIPESLRNYILGSQMVSLHHFFWCTICAKPILLHIFFAFADITNAAFYFVKIC